MFESNIKYNFHDSILISSHFEDDRLILEIQLYEIYYPAKNKIRLTFTGIFNIQKVAQLNEELNLEKNEDWIGFRIEALHLDDRKESKEGDIYAFVKIDYLPPITIHCKQLNIEDEYLK